jgi:MFS family permease
MLRFLTENLRWLATGFLLAIGSSFGQTYFISLFAGEIRETYGLSDGDWGLLYTGATLCSAMLLLGKGGWADTVPLSRLAPIIAAVFAGAALLMALGTQVWMLVTAVFLLRFCGQGMFTHIKATAMARWFVATRGRAMAITNLGYPLGESLLPVPVLLLAAWIGWRMTWGVTAVVIALVVLPLLTWLLSQDRSPAGQAAISGSPGLGARHWQRPEVLRHWVFWALVPFFLTPGFIGTVIFFHQVHVSEVKGWSLTAMATGYATYAATTIATSFVAGWVADRFGPALLAHIRQPPGHRRRRRHGGAHQVRAPAAALAALEVAVRGGGAALARRSWSGFIARHMEQPASRHSKPGLLEDVGQPLFLGLRAHEARARHDHGAQPSLIFLPFRISAAARRSSIRPLVQEPMKTVSISISDSGVPGSAPCSPATARRVDLAALEISRARARCR